MVTLILSCPNYFTNIIHPPTRDSVFRQLHSFSKFWQKYVVLSKIDMSRPLFRLFSSFQTNIAIFTTNKCEKCPSSKRCWDSNPQPSSCLGM